MYWLVWSTVTKGMLIAALAGAINNFMARAQGYSKLATFLLVCTIHAVLAVCFSIRMVDYMSWSYIVLSATLSIGHATLYKAFIDIGTSADPAMKLVSNIIGKCLFYAVPVAICHFSIIQLPPETGISSLTIRAIQMLSLCTMYMIHESHSNAVINKIILHAVSAVAEIEQLHHIELVTPWTMSILAIRVVISLLTIIPGYNFNKTHITFFNYATTLATLIFALVTHATASFIDSGLEYTLCDWKHPIILVALCVITFLIVSFYNNLNYRRMLMLSVFTICLGGFIGIPSSRYLLIVLPLYIFSLLEATDKILSMFVIHSSFIKYMKGIMATPLQNRLTYAILSVLAICSYALTCKHVA
jgi:hypothetical protein